MNCIRKKYVREYGNLYHIDDELSKNDMYIKKILNNNSLIADEKIEGNLSKHRNSGYIIANEASAEIRRNLYIINPLNQEAYIFDILSLFEHLYPYYYEPNDIRTQPQHTALTSQDVYQINKELLQSMEDREMIDVSRLERLIYLAFDSFKDFISNINDYIKIFNLSSDNINRKINYNLFTQSDKIITQDRLCLNLRSNLNIEKLFQIFIEREYINPETDLENFYDLFSHYRNIIRPIIWIKKTSKKQKSKSSLIDFLKILGISSKKLHDKNIIEKYFQDDEGKPMKLNLYNNKANERSEYYDELKSIIEEVSTK